MPKPQVKQVLSGKVDPEVIKHIDDLANAEGVRPSSMLNIRLRELRTCDKMIARLPRDKRLSLAQIVQLYVDRHRNGALNK